MSTGSHFIKRLSQYARTHVAVLVVFVLAILGLLALPTINKSTVFATVTVTSSDVTVNEADGKATFTFNAHSDNSDGDRIQYFTTDGTATSPDDYTETKSNLTIPFDDSTFTVDVPIIDDTTIEPNETFTITVEQIDVKTFGNWTGTIVDNDAPTPTPIPPTGIPPTGIPPTGIPPTGVPPTGVPPTPTPTKKFYSPGFFAPSNSPTDIPEPTTEPEPTTKPEVKGESEKIQPERSAFVRSVLAPNEVPFTMEYLTKGLLISGFLILLILFPSEIFNATVQSNYDEIIHWFWIHKLQQYFKKIQQMPHLLMVVIFAVISAFINSLLSPDFGFNKPTLALVLGMLIALFAGATIYDVTRAFYMKKRFGHRSKLRAHSFGLFMGALLVTASRLAHFLPGYCYGLFTGLVFRTNPKDNEDGEGLAFSSLLLIGIAVTGWFLWIPVKAAANTGHPGLIVLIIDAAFASFWVSTLTATVFGLMPMRFLYGEQVKKWNGWVWLAIYVTGVFLFVYTLVNPAIGIYGESDKVSLYSVLALFAVFGAFSMSFWGYFRYRHLWGGGPKK